MSREPDITETTRGGVRKWWRAETRINPRLTVVTVQHAENNPDPDKVGKYETLIAEPGPDDRGRQPVKWSSAVLTQSEDDAMQIHASMTDTALRYNPDDEATGVPLDE